MTQTDAERAAFQKFIEAGIAKRRTVAARCAPFLSLKEVFTAGWQARGSSERERAQWTLLPDEQAWYWHWTGEDYAVPHIYSVMASCSSQHRRYFLAYPDLRAPAPAFSSSQHHRYFLAYPDLRWCDEMGGFWLKIGYPNVPTRTKPAALKESSDATKG
jgi:hypothetical protein